MEAESEGEEEDEGEEEHESEGEEEGEEAERGRPSAAQQAARAAMKAAGSAAKARAKAEREHPYADVRVGYVLDLFTSPRFDGLDAASRHAVLLHVVHYHERHVLEHEGAVADGCAAACKSSCQAPSSV